MAIDAGLPKDDTPVTLRRTNRAWRRSAPRGNERENPRLSDVLSQQLPNKFSDLNYAGPLDPGLVWS
jgi:hypothetical protein